MKRQVNSSVSSPTASDLSKGKIIERRSIYVIGVHEMLAKKEILSSSQLFGRFGLIQEIRDGGIHPLKNQEVRHRFYITYESEFSAALAVAAMHGHKFKGSIFQCSYSTNKYCNEYLSGAHCSKSRQGNCHFVHDPVLENDFMPEQEDNKIFFNKLKTQAFCFLRHHLQCCLQDFIDYIESPEYQKELEKRNQSWQNPSGPQSSKEALALLNKVKKQIKSFKYIQEPNKLLEYLYHEDSFGFGTQRKFDKSLLQQQEFHHRPAAWGFTPLPPLKPKKSCFSLCQPGNLEQKQAQSRQKSKLLNSNPENQIMDFYDDRSRNADPHCQNHKKSHRWPINGQQSSMNPPSQSHKQEGFLSNPIYQTELNYNQDFYNQQRYQQEQVQNQEIYVQGNQYINQTLPQQYNQIQIFPCYSGLQHNHQQIQGNPANFQNLTQNCQQQQPTNQILNNQSLSSINNYVKQDHFYAYPDPNAPSQQQGQYYNQPPFIDSPPQRNVGSQQPFNPLPHQQPPAMMYSQQQNSSFQHQFCPQPVYIPQGQFGQSGSPQHQYPSTPFRAGPPFQGPVGGTPQPGYYQQTEHQNGPVALTNFNKTQQDFQNQQKVGSPYLQTGDQRQWNQQSALAAPVHQYDNQLAIHSPGHRQKVVQSNSQAGMTFSPKDLSERRSFDQQQQIAAQLKLSRQLRIQGQNYYQETAYNRGQFKAKNQPIKKQLSHQKKQ